MWYPRSPLFLDPLIDLHSPLLLVLVVVEEPLHLYLCSNVCVRAILQQISSHLYRDLEHQKLHFFPWHLFLSFSLFSLPPIPCDVCLSLPFLVSQLPPSMQSRPQVLCAAPPKSH